MEYLWAALFVLTLLTGWVLTLISLPGNWLMVVAAALYAWVVHQNQRLDIGWPVVVGLLALAGLGELLEAVASAAGVAQKGGSKRAALLSAVGAVPGALVGSLLGAAFPLFILVFVVVCAGLGALGGAMLGEWWKGRTLNQSWQIGQGAFWGRVLGSMAKLTIATMMVVLGLAALAWK